MVLDKSSRNIYNKPINHVFTKIYKQKFRVIIKSTDFTVKVFKEVRKMKKISRLFLTFIITIALLPSIASAQKEVVILHTNDVHSRIDDDGKEIGYRFC